MGFGRRGGGVGEEVDEGGVDGGVWKVSEEDDDDDDDDEEGDGGVGGGQAGHRQLGW